LVRARAAAMRKRINGITPAALAALEAYDWPGNVRELENVIERACVLAPADAAIDLAQLSLDMFDTVTPAAPTGVSPSVAPAPAAVTTPPSPIVLPETTMDELERMAIEQTLAKYNGNRAQTARALKIGTKTLYRKIEKYGITS
jgi:DNA-binding NtrC family response regulator